MRWQGRRGSRNIEDRRRMGGGMRRGGRGMAVGGGGLGAVAVVLIALFFGIDPSVFTGGSVPTGDFAQGGSAEITPADERAAEFVSVTLADTEEVWAGIFQEQLGQQYRPVTLVLFKGARQSACGGASAQTGPFYCPADKKVYLDTDFFTTMERQLGAGGDFAAAYVVAHEVGHYVQDELGILAESQRGERQGAESAAVRAELQADCFAGVWAHYAQNELGTIEAGDIEEAMNAAAQIGDDTLQRESGQTVRPDAFTHGSSEQRERWFYTGFESGDVGACDTFSSNDL